MSCVVRPRTSTLFAMAVAALACSALLVGCATQPAASSRSATASKESSLVGERDAFACITNNTSGTVTVTWYVTPNYTSSFDRQGELKPGDRFCGEGDAATATVLFSDGFGTDIIAANHIVGYPSLSFMSNSRHMAETDYRSGQEKEFWDEEYATANYAQMETIGSDIGAHHFTVFRQADTDWVNFAISIDK